MTTIDIPTKIHKKLKKEALQRDMDLKDLVAERLGVIVMIAMLAVGGLGLAYAEEVNLPLEDPYADTWCIFLAAGDHVKFTCNWTWFLPDYVMAEINQTIAPALIRDIPQHNLGLADKIRLLLESPPEFDDIMKLDFEEFLEPEEPLTKEEREIEAAVKKLAKCRTGIGPYAGTQEHEEIEGYTDQTRWEFSIRDNLSQSPIIGQMLKAIEECRIMQTYIDMNLIGDYEKNKYLADVAGVDYLGRLQNPIPGTTDQSDNVLTDPVTPKDIADERTEMEELRDDLIDQGFFKDPDAPFTGENRGGQTEGARCQEQGQPHDEYGSPVEVCPMDLYNKHILDNFYTLTDEDIQQLLCTYYLTQYAHQIGTDNFPAWLNHCVPKVVRE